MLVSGANATIKNRTYVIVMFHASLAGILMRRNDLWGWRGGWETGGEDGTENPAGLCYMLVSGAM